jgi:hypothetical protein
MEIGSVNSGGNTTLKEAQGDIVETTTTHITLDIKTVEDILSQSSLNNEQRQQFRKTVEEIVVHRESGNGEKFKAAIKSLINIGVDEAAEWFSKLLS